GLNTQPCGAPVLSVRLVEVMLPSRTACGLSVRKFSIQLHMEGLMFRSCSCMMSLDGTMVLKAELKSMKSIRTYVLFWSRWERAVFKAKAMTSSVDLFGL